MFDMDGNCVASPLTLPKKYFTKSIHMFNITYPVMNELNISSCKVTSIAFLQRFEIESIYLGLVKEPDLSEIINGFELMFCLGLPSTSAKITAQVYG